MKSAQIHPLKNAKSRNKKPRAPIILITTYPERLRGEVVPGVVLCNPLEIAELCREIRARQTQ
jgi:hypothetical protein